MGRKDSIIGHAAALVAYAIFGFNIIVCKDLTSGMLMSISVTFLDSPD